MAKDKEKNEAKQDKEIDLHTEGPISEKDEVKQAEDRTKRSNEKTDSSVAADLKNREHN